MRHEDMKEQSGKHHAHDARQNRPRHELKSEQLEHVAAGGGWGMAQYQYGFEGTYHNG